MKKRSFVKTYSKKIGFIGLPIFLALFIMVNMGLLYFVMTMINIGISDEVLDKLPYVLDIEFWILGLFISLFVLFQILSGYGILLSWHQISEDLIKRELDFHEEIHGLMEENKD